MFVYPKRYDVIVVGGGHAGIEAALAAARMGCQTLLLTINADTIGQMSCNPAIGGLAKGHLAREIDAMGGEMGKATDMTGLQFRMLNTRKGPAVRAPRAQCDKKAYQFRMKWICERQPNLDIKQGQTARLLCRDGRVVGVETTLEVQYLGTTVVVTTGTFLRGLMHIGLNQQSGGRAGEGAAQGLSASLREVGLELGRLKTGTPPRLLRRSIDFSRTEVQPGDEPVPWFTFWKEDLFHVEHSGMLPHPVSSDRPSSSRYPPGSILNRTNGQLPCYITYTTPRTAEIIRENLHKSPMYSGVIEGIGPRYCPSIEDKIVRFPEKERQQIFLEPEGIATDEIYVNGCSTSLPYDVQIELVKTIIGCESAEIVRPAYAVEYDFVFPTQLYPSLETKVCRNLYLAGQINGTSGYEEAAAQGLMAGINAARRVQGKEPIVLRRDQAYIGVLIDDLVTRGTTEPYRMFTSRAEYRLLLRQDNADMRLCQIGYDVGLLPERNYRRFVEKKARITAELSRLASTRIGMETLAQILKRPEVRYTDLPQRNPSLTEEEIQQVEIELKYAGYIERQKADIEKLRGLEDKQIPAHFDYSLVPGLRTEARLKLSQIRPTSIGQASRISGVSPSDISILLVWLKRGTRAPTGELVSSEGE
ncbi:MAG TPA: tRNA uridine-5-carboxymethylaminomethyl(34) synthesis enzyme MnmG [Verrucomicrobia bacterium]|nr:tRNA uridine-5-carboxymethylaminomethyl(34) synthesis enzyme MnmG [Verrucomicrobiota bacterium]HOP95951.1 tRNA uridine-5-carboxymethylaminomethyl(34) synthesis enzyme MnmG [Verrucomicrobiota bacterium]